MYSSVIIKFIVKYLLPNLEDFKEMKKFKMDTEEILTPQDWGFPVPISYGPGRIAEIGKACLSMGVKNPLIVTDSGSKELPFVEKLKEILIGSNIGSDLYSKISPNPRDNEIDDGCSKFKSGNHDAIIAIGGGSAMDGGKAICLTANNDIPLWDFEWEKHLKR